MQYVDLAARVGDLSGVVDPAHYVSHLPSISAALPPGARAFATDTDHYDFRSLRCVKDLAVRTVQGAGGDEMVVEFQHNCWKHDRDLVVRYSGVSSFILESAAGGRGTNIGIVILDEILPHRDGCSHEIAGWDGTLTVVCRDLQAIWMETACSNEA